MIRLLLISLLVFPGCNFLKKPVQVTVIYDVLPLDPPVMPTKDQECHAFGFDGLACEETGLAI